MGSLASLGDYGMMSSVDIKGNSSVRNNGQDRGLLAPRSRHARTHEEAFIEKTLAPSGPNNLADEVERS